MFQEKPAGKAEKREREKEKVATEQRKAQNFSNLVKPPETLQHSNQVAYDRKMNFSNTL